MSTEDSKTMQGIFNEALDQKVRQREREQFWDKACLLILEVDSKRGILADTSPADAETMITYLVGGSAKLADRMLLARDASEIRKGPR